MLRFLHNTRIVIANEVKQSCKPLTFQEIAILNFFQDRLKLTLLAMTKTIMQRSSNELWDCHGLKPSQ
jgi:hypothetical protein